MMPGLAWQVIRQTASAVGPTTPWGCPRGHRGGAGRCLVAGDGRVRVVGQVGKQQELVGVEAFAAWSEQPAQQYINAVPQGLVVPLAGTQGGQYFQEHALERGRVVRQLCGGGVWRSSSSVRDAHVSYTHHR